MRTVGPLDRSHINAQQKILLGHVPQGVALGWVNQRPFGATNASKHHANNLIPYMPLVNFVCYVSRKGHETPLEMSSVHGVPLAARCTSITWSTLDWLTENAPYPFCQWNSDRSGACCLTHFDVSVFNTSTNPATVTVRASPQRTCTWSTHPPTRAGGQPI